MLLFQQGIKHVQFAVARVPFGVARHAGPDGAAGDLREVLQQRKAAVIGTGRLPRVTADGEHFGDAGVVAVPDHAGQLLTAFDASCGQVRNNLEAKVGKLNGRPDGGSHALAGQARHRQLRPRGPGAWMRAAIPSEGMICIRTGSTVPDLPACPSAGVGAAAGARRDRIVMRNSRFGRPRVARHGSGPSPLCIGPERFRKPIRACLHRR
ncbi:hypothetical protein NicSoilC5_32290 [Arthrobacter sp. NicSoilC5]|nr:hypothetical protein NicSoilC5_32290 [Arthrobacter sp. NicSoilC5]